MSENPLYQPVGRDDLITFQVPSGIGDISWLWSKLRHVALERPVRFEAATGYPFRAHEYLELLPELASHGYSTLEFRDIIGVTALHKWTTWAEIADLIAKGVRTFPLENNLHLERGKPLRDWFPDLPTDYHYPMEITDEHKARADKLLNGTPDGALLIGVSCASYRGANAWKTWRAEQWLDLLTRLFERESQIVYVMMGGGWDDLTREVGERLADATIPVIHTTGRTSFGAAMAIHGRLGYYIGFSSGLGILRTVLRKPTLMLWPDHQYPLSTSWADPEDVSSALYRTSGYGPPETVYWAIVSQWREVGITG